jgi:hypothetical protein
MRIVFIAPASCPARLQRRSRESVQGVVRDVPRSLPGVRRRRYVDS